eukprot:3212511-Rhodomonas_salina.3
MTAPASPSSCTSRVSARATRNNVRSRTCRMCAVRAGGPEGGCRRKVGALEGRWGEEGDKGTGGREDNGGGGKEGRGGEVRGRER